MKKHNRKSRLCLVSSSGGHWEQFERDYRFKSNTSFRDDLRKFAEWYKEF